MHWKKTKKLHKYGKCNICRTYGSLSWDHIPPKQCGNAKSVFSEKAMSFLTNEKEKPSISQNGVKSRTLCEYCNNTVLGTWYDPALKEFFEYINSVVSSKLIMPNKIRVRCRPSAVMRAILGHLLAAKQFDHRSKNYEAAAYAVLHPDEPIPKDINCFYYVYPHMDTQILMEFGMKVDGHDSTCEFMSFFPLAFLITNTDTAFGLNSFSQYHSSSIDEYRDVLFSVKDRKPYGWPWHPEYSNFILAGKEFNSSLIARPRMPK